ncbi:heme lyase CcmF/NrfE family subunit [Vibrio coralliilyticus]|uniref:heme lyase CcmF/NrfE family subunit n=1 Tax=Vibrio coralliilyticus TaxID=190893 RepID=UPI0006CC9573|nr:heme lyase CcmF/NrfE family subunit [Vibrio coralliilyticus]AXN32713.1 heme lyase CcmF/NrfE family subunit [Vibrio coralliilyticus]KPH25769.1 cytochrome C [Vibrio coralliilyticus]
MWGEIGHFVLIWVAVSSIVCAAVWAWQHYFDQGASLSLIWPVRLNAAMASLSLIILAILFASDRFEFAYVATHSNIALPPFFKLAAVWGGHQGSMLFWVFTLNLWAGLISFIRHSNGRYIAHVLWIMTLFVAAFSWFTLLASNPFVYAQTLLTQGRDLNPMLQDVGLIFHPPLLYLGYIGYSTVLAFALAALMQKTYDNQWVTLCKPWAISAWAFLTLGILVGSWWAYNELGWGGWWFWDPVENASLLPWLTGTALLHSMVASRRHQQLMVWTLILALVTFSLSILGTFIVRSGVLTSVHAFAVDPGKGIALLGILAVTLFASFALLIDRGETIRSQKLTAIVSRSYLVLLAIGLLVIATFTVFLGTFYPMVYELLQLGTISVGAPYFNTLLLPLSALALTAMGWAPFLKWQSGLVNSWQRMVVFFVFSFLAGAMLYFGQMETSSSAAMLIWGLACWVVFSHLWWAIRLGKLNFMLLAHIGLAIGAIGCVMNAEHSSQLTRKLGPGMSAEFRDWQVEYLKTEWRVDKNFTAEEAQLRFTDAEGRAFELKPERRHYPVRVMNMSEPAIHSTWLGDYYVTLAAKVDGHSYAVKIQYKAYIWWIWGGGLLATFAAFLPLITKLSPRIVRTKYGVVQKV